MAVKPEFMSYLPVYNIILKESFGCDVSQYQHYFHSLWTTTTLQDSASFQVTPVINYSHYSGGASQPAWVKRTF